MIEEINTDDFEDWLKEQADKHRMYPSDKLWRNINQQMHGQSRWPALTFGAILTGALFTSALIFLHPQKDAFSFHAASASVQAVANNTSTHKADSYTTNQLKPVDNKAAIYSFNYTDLSAEDVLSLPTAPDSQALVDLVTEDNLQVLAATTSKLNEELSVAPTDENLSKPQNITPAIVLHASTLANNDESANDIVGNEGISEVSRQSTEESATADEAQDLANVENEFAKKIQLSQNKAPRWNIEVYGGPNINYRRLNEPRSYDYHQPYNSSLGSRNSNNVNNVVKQRPSIGFNVGSAFTYALSDRLKLKAGLQFNFRQYTIDAFQSQYERSVLLLNNGLLYPDSVYTYSVISNGQGANAITLNNRYYQVGIPVGLEWTMIKFSPKVQLNVAASFQPTYQLNSDIYLITSDYKSYVQAPKLLRHLNINAGAEATLGFDAGGVKWQVGPQILYQTLPTQKENYSIREHLFDYGVRIGIVKQLR